MDFSVWEKSFIFVKNLERLKSLEETKELTKL